MSVGQDCSVEQSVDRQDKEYVQLNCSEPRDAIRPKYPCKIQVLWILKTRVLVLKNRIRDAKYSVFLSHSHYAYEHFDFPIFGENRCRVTTVMKQPLTE
jgi:hypothetical protein